MPLLNNEPCISTRDPNLGNRLPYAYCLAFFFILFVFVAEPAFFRQFYSTSEEQVAIFSGAYGWRLFYPGSNRIAMVVPLIFSWLGTPTRIAIAHFVLNAAAISAALALLAYALPRKLFVPYCVSVFAAIAVLFGGGIYQLHLSVVQPYLLPTSIGVMCSVFILSAQGRGVTYALKMSSVFLLMLAAAGINPSVAMQFMLFFAFKLALTFFFDIPPSISVGLSWTKRLVWVTRNRANLLIGMGLNLIAIAVIFYGYEWYKNEFPQYVLSNYSVASYLNSGISFSEFRKTIGFILDYHGAAGLFGASVSRILISAVMLSGLVSLVLWRWRRYSAPVLASLYANAFLVWLAAVVVIIVLSQNAHIQIVPNEVRGRYFSSTYYVMTIALCVTVATAASEVFGDRGKRYEALFLSALAVLTGGGSFLAHLASSGAPSTSIFKTRADIVAVANEVRAKNVSAILGNYWWIWDVQQELNANVARTPMIAPITIRTEAFGLNVFRPITDELSKSKAFRFVCIELKDPPPGLEEGCLPQIDSYRSKGAFPLGEFREIERSEADRFKFTLYEMSVANANDVLDCTRSEITLRAKSAVSTIPGQTSYNLDEDSFVYLQRPEPRADWILRFTREGHEEVVIVPRDGPTNLHIFQHRIGVIGEGCRVLVTLSRRDRLLPGIIKLDVR
jgi:hypothetical protein